MRRTIRIQLETEEVAASSCPKCGAMLDTPDSIARSPIRQLLDYLEALLIRQRLRRLS